MPVVGEIWRYAQFYTDAETGELLDKFFLVLAVQANRDVTYRLLTSREYNRVRAPACLHEGDRPGYYLGIPQPTPPLNQPTWLDLREADDFDALEFEKLRQNGTLTLICNVAQPVLCPALICAAYAQDTTKAQKNHMMASRQTLGCV